MNKIILIILCVVFLPYDTKAKTEQVKRRWDGQEEHKPSDRANPRPRPLESLQEILYHFERNSIIRRTADIIVMDHTIVIGGITSAIARAMTIFEAKKPGQIINRDQASFF